MENPPKSNIRIILDIKMHTAWEKLNKIIKI